MIVTRQLWGPNLGALRTQNPPTKQAKIAIIYNEYNNRSNNNNSSNNSSDNSSSSNSSNNSSTNNANNPQPYNWVGVGGSWDLQSRLEPWHCGSRV